MIKFLAFLAFVAYAFAAGMVGNWALGFKPDPMLPRFTSGDILLLIGEAAVLMYVVARGRWLHKTYHSYSQAFETLKYWAIGVSLLLIIEPLVSLFVSGELSLSLSLFWFYARYFSLIVAPVAIWGGRATDYIWRDYDIRHVPGEKARWKTVFTLRRS
jgi:hypothetical protein